jgi:hypothetical protein
LRWQREKGARKRRKKRREEGRRSYLDSSDVNCDGIVYVRSRLGDVMQHSRKLVERESAVGTDADGFL